MVTEPLMKEKRESSALLPYYKKGGTFHFFLQKRDKNAPRAPGVFGLFGGGLEEGEDITSALLREIREELSYAPEHHVYFSRYEYAKLILHVFLEEVDENFGSRVTVAEGEYGKFLSLEETQTLKEVSPSARLVAHQVAEFVQ